MYKSAWSARTSWHRERLDIGIDRAIQTCLQSLSVKRKKSKEKGRARRDVALISRLSGTCHGRCLLCRHFGAAFFCLTLGIVKCGEVFARAHCSAQTRWRKLFICTHSSRYIYIGGRSSWGASFMPVCAFLVGAREGRKRSLSYACWLFLIHVEGRGTACCIMGADISISNVRENGWILSWVSTQIICWSANTGKQAKRSFL